MKAVVTRIDPKDKQSVRDWAKMEARKLKAIQNAFKPKQNN